MSAFTVVLAVSLSTVGGLLVWHALVVATARVEAAVAPYARFDEPAPADARLLPCPGSCPGLTWQRRDGDGWLLCGGCWTVQRDPVTTAP